MELGRQHHQLDQALKRLAERLGNEPTHLDQGWLHRFLSARLTWSEYQEDMVIPAQERTRYSNISCDVIFDSAASNLTDGLSLTLETTS